METFAHHCEQGTVIFLATFKLLHYIISIYFNILGFSSFICYLHMSYAIQLVLEPSSQEVNINRVAVNTVIETSPANNLQ